jgi:hypothetical protein
MRDTGRDIDMETWPSTLPTPAYGGKIKHKCGLNSAEEDINPERLRTYPEREGVFTLDVITPTQWQTLRTFYSTTLNDGCAGFTASWLEEMGFEFHYLRFSEPPRIDSIDTGFYKASLMLEIVTGLETDTGGDPLIWPPIDELVPEDKWG